MQGNYLIEGIKLNISNWRAVCVERRKHGSEGRQGYSILCMESPALPYHVGESENSFTATLPNKWACLADTCIANRDGKKGGNVLDFVAVMEDCSIRDAALKLQQDFNVEASNERPADYVPSRDRTEPAENTKLVARKKKELSIPNCRAQKSI